MEKYEVEIKEELSRIVEIEAESHIEAVRKAEAKYAVGEIVLDASDFKGGEVKPYDEEIKKVMGGR